MQNNINKNEQDAFSEMIRQKLENHKVPVDANSWDKINARLKSTKRIIIPFWFWLSGGAVAAAVALLIILRPLSVPTDTIGKAKSMDIQQKTIQTRQITNNLPPKSIQSAKATIKPVQPNAQPSSQFKTTIGLDYPPAQIPYTELVDSNKTTGNADISQRKENNIAQNTTVLKDTVSKSIRNIPNSLVEKPDNEPIGKTKNKRSWLLAASVGSNGNVPGGNGNYELSVGDKYIVNAATSYTGIMTPNNFSNISYNPPVSVGLIIRKNLNKTLGLESGLVYTYLLTTFENNGVQRNDARLHLHYIGVPLNLVAQLWNNSKWEIYLSGGGMIEKGIKSIYVQNLYSSTQTITTTATTDINGVQWSVNGAVGTTYKIQRNVGIFFEPKISYYFDNNQPLSARTEYPVVIGLTAGVRFQFK